VKRVAKERKKQKKQQDVNKNGNPNVPPIQNNKWMPSDEGLWRFCTCTKRFAKFKS
jgi:hypothetical protein